MTPRELLRALVTAVALPSAAGAHRPVWLELILLGVAGALAAYHLVARPEVPWYSHTAAGLVIASIGLRRFLEWRQRREALKREQIAQQPGG
jgi:hypothetical protein